jgi:predicted house-cleaning NTP pyrophosphatase (Maf/HAM1 superfamily)
MDVDVIVAASPDEIKRLTELVLAAGFKKVRSVSQPIGEDKLVVESKEGYRADISQAKAEHDVEAVKRGEKIGIFDVDVWVVAPENLVLQKLVLGRPKDIKDAVAVLMRQRGKLDEGYLKDWASKLKVSGELKELMKKVK